MLRESRILVQLIVVAVATSSWYTRTTCGLVTTPVHRDIPGASFDNACRTRASRSKNRKYGLNLLSMGPPRSYTRQNLQDRVQRNQGRGRQNPQPEAFALKSDERLQKFLSHAGLDSRRQCEQMILDGRVRVNGKMVKQLGMKVDPNRDQVHVDGNRVFPRPKSEVRWVALNKPKGVICTASDELGRPTAVEVVPRGKEMRLMPVGRLDRDSCGLILLTNENSWINPLTHPSYGHEKTYRVSITSGYPSADEWKTLTTGMLLEDDPSPTRPCIVEVIDFDRRTKFTTVDVTIREGRNRQIRRMFEGIGHEVKSITRISHGPIRLKKLRPGEWRTLEKWEIDKLKNLTTKTLKNPTKSARTASRKVSSLENTKLADKRAASDDDDDDRWNDPSTWGTRSSNDSWLSRRHGRAAYDPEEEDRYEWKSPSWVREDESRSKQPPKGKSKGKGRKKESEADRLLRQLAEGVPGLKTRNWEGGGRVEREARPLRTGKRQPWSNSRFGRDD